MAAMRVHRVDTSRRSDVNRFVEVPFALYRDCPQWVPPLRSEVCFSLNRRKHPFYEHSDAEFFLVEADGRDVGRVAVIDNRNYNRHHDRRSAFFYFFECVDDVAAARALFDAAFVWARGRGLEVVSGPRGFLAGDGIGLLVEGFQHRPAVGIPYNLPYYERLLLACGFTKETESYSGHLSSEYVLNPRYFEVAQRVMERRGLRIKTFPSKRELVAWAPRIREVYDASFRDLEGYYPLTERELAVVAERLLSIADHRLIKLVIKGETVIGFLFTFHDISAGLQRIRGRLWPFGWLVLMREFKRTEWANINGMGLLPEHRGVGANAVLYTEMAKSVRGFGFKHADVVQVGAKNAKSLAEMAALGVQWYKTHRVYRCAI